jgi:methylenetetrahydrofolate reductase (NADPH)
MNRSLIDEALEEAKALGIKNILALRGDPPRSEEYMDNGAETNGHSSVDSNAEFTWAVDLVRYIKKQHGDYFCIGVAAYPEGHSDATSTPEHQSPEHDLPYLIEKTKAGADFIMTQLFFDIDKYRHFESLLRNDPSGVFKTIPIIPCLMPIQSYQILRRTTKLSHASLPPDILARLDAVKGDDEAVKKVGVEILSEIVEGLRQIEPPGPKGFHFYTLNLEKVVSQIVEKCGLISTFDSEEEEEAIEITPDISINGMKQRRRLSSIQSNPHNRVIVDRTSTSSHKSHEALDSEAGIPTDDLSSRAATLAISEGEGTLGREATWDDYPNGRWGDARSPAFGEIDGYGVSLHISIPQAIKLWNYPTSTDDISEIFKKYILGDLEAIPWSEEKLLPETKTISSHLLKLNSKGWWSVASQPAVNGLKSSDPIFGWGPKNGFVFQKPFIELFLPSTDWATLKSKIDATSQVTYFAGNAAGEFEASDADSANPVTWGTFPSKEIVTPTIIEAVSFRAWCEEAFCIWAEWMRIYPRGSKTARLLGRVREEYWLVNFIHHDFVERDALWDLLLS